MFLYLRTVIGFSLDEVATFIAVLGILSVIAQTLVLACLKRTVGLKNCVLIGLIFEMLQLSWYGLGSQVWMMWAAGSLASISMITYPAVSAYVSCSADADQQGVVQGIVTGIRGLCNGIGPALFGLVFYVFHVHLDEDATATTLPQSTHNHTGTMMKDPFDKTIVTGAPFLFGAGSVILALLLAFFIPENVGHSYTCNPRSPSRRAERPVSLSESSNVEDSQGVVYNSNQDSVPLLDDTEA